MPQNQAPVPYNEMERLLDLSKFDLDYSNLEDSFSDLTNLAARVAGTEISLINLIDSYTQWSVARYGLDIEQMPREDSVCQYTIMEGDHFEVEDLSADERFHDKNYVSQPLSLRYYFGIPLKTHSGSNIGALCVLDTKFKKLSPEKIEMLRLIGREIITRLETVKRVQDLTNKLADTTEKSKRVVHDIRGPLSGIIGISEIISEQGDKNKLDDILEFINLIHKSSRSILDLADEILNEEKGKLNRKKDDDFNLFIFRDKLEKLYNVQAANKNVELSFTINPEHGNFNFSKAKLLQIVGNLISNAIKFTPAEGKINVSLELKLDVEHSLLKINVMDTGDGMTQETIDSIMKGDQQTTKGTNGEVGYGFGLAMVKHLIDSLNGEMNINSTIGVGTRFEVLLPVKTQLK